MSDRTRLRLFIPATAVLAVFMLRAVVGLPGFGRYPGPYGDLLNARGVAERHLTNLVSAVNFDYRGLDTLGEEFILFAAVTGVVLLLRVQPGEAENLEEKATVPGREWRDPEEAVQSVSFVLVGLLALFGFYIVLHAQLTPGGGFQGGAITGTASLLIYLGYDYHRYHRLTRKAVADAAEAIGAGGYAVVGIACLVAGGSFLQNILPLGQTGTLLSSGTILVINFCVGVEVAAGFALLFLEFTKEIHRTGDRPAPSEKPEP